MARSYEKEIARAILAAQIASDLAKFDKLNTSYFYQIKDSEIKNAIKLICISRSKKYRFSVQKGDITPYLVYFTMKSENSRERRLQVSFHSFSAGLEKYLSSASCRTRWDKNSSRQSAVEMAYHYNIYNDVIFQVEDGYVWENYCL